jgi:hypothetical protein
MSVATTALVHWSSGSQITHARLRSPRLRAYRGFVLGVWYLLAADLSRLTILLTAIVLKMTRLKFAEREATRLSDDT